MRPRVRRALSAAALPFPVQSIAIWFESCDGSAECLFAFAPAAVQEPSFFFTAFHVQNGMTNKNWIPASAGMMKRGFLCSARCFLHSRKPAFLALRVVGLGDRLGQVAYAQDVTLALGYADRAARVEQVERVAGLHHLLVGRQ